MARGFDFLDFNEDKTKEIAEIMSNKTSRKIIDYLKGKEASETDISNEFKIAPSTVHYNVQKLIKNGLIEVKSSYWSTKGNKVNLYKTSDKVLVFSHEKSEYLKDKFTKFIPLFFLIFALIAVNLSYLYVQDLESNEVILYLSISQTQIAENAELTLFVISKKDIKSISGEIVLPDNIKIIEGNLEWETSLTKDEPKQINFLISSIKEGTGVIRVSTTDDSESTSLVVSVDSNGKITTEPDSGKEPLEEITDPDETEDETEDETGEETDTRSKKIQLSERQKELIEEIIRQEDPEILEKTSFFRADTIPEEPDQLKVLYLIQNSIPQSPRATIIIDMENEEVISIEKEWWEVELSFSYSVSIKDPNLIVVDQLELLEEPENYNDIKITGNDVTITQVFSKLYPCNGADYTLTKTESTIDIIPIDIPEEPTFDLETGEKFHPTCKIVRSYDYVEINTLLSSGIYTLNFYSLEDNNELLFSKEIVIE